MLRWPCSAHVWRRTARLLAGYVSLALLPLVGCKPATETATAPPVMEVTVAKPLVQTVTDSEEFIGRTKAAEYVEIRSRVTGYLVKILFEDGDEIAKGQELFEIDPRPFRADYNKALADVKVAEAEVKYRTADVERNRPLLASKSVTQADFDKMVALQDEAVATLESRRAQANTAALNLSFTKILSPIAGRASRAKVTYGNLVQADSTLLTTVVSVDPMFVYFSPDEATHLRVQAAARDGRLKLDKGKIDVWMELANETGFPHRGVIDFSENQVDAATGTIEVRGVFDNPKPATGNRELEPGLFCRVRVPLGDPYQAVMVTERAIGSDQGQKFVLVVDSDHKVEQRRVELGRLEDGMRVIVAGLSADEPVIVSGLQRARAGSTVKESSVDMADYVKPRQPRGGKPAKSGAPPAAAGKPAAGGPSRAVKAAPRQVPDADLEPSVPATSEPER